MLQRTRLDKDWWLAPATSKHAPEKLRIQGLEWLTAQVPGQVHLDLIRHGVIAHPHERLYELGARWVDELDWKYRTRFEFSPNPELPTRILRFQGLDTVCSIELNGDTIAEHDNMFVPLEIDVTKRLRTGENQLELLFKCAAEVGRQRRARYFADQGLDLNTVWFEERAFLRKAQYMFGWDWGPRLVSTGIWQPVELLEHAGRIRRVQVAQRFRADGSVELRFQSQVEGAGASFHFVEGFEAPVTDREPLILREPKRWWPAGFGDQHLYGVESLLIPIGTRPESLKHQSVIDRHSFRIGIRSVRLLQEEDRFGQSFEFEINGRRIWVMGANWIPDSSFLAEISSDRLRNQLLRARDLKMNMLRVWGGGVYESEDFYDACDQLGILIWQDFPYACSYTPDDARSQAVAREEARDAIERLHHHPSLVLWCGNNENQTMFESKWGNAKLHPPRFHGEAIFERVLPELLQELDPERPYLPSSPCGGSPANSGGIGDQHCWEVWHGRGDYLHYRDSTARFCSEFGFASAPGPAAWARIASHVDHPLALPALDPHARFHDKTEKGIATFVRMVEEHYPSADSIEEWLYTSQLNQRDALRFGIEHFRRSEFCRGTLIWQLNDCWPAQSWAVIDSENHYKAAAYELRRLYAPLLLSIQRTGAFAELWAVFDNSTEAIRGDALLEARSLTDGALLGRFTAADVQLAPGDRRPLLQVELAGLDPQSTLLVARFSEATALTLLTEPKQVRLREPRLRIRSIPEGLQLETDAPIVDLFVWDDAGQFQPQDNFVTLPEPGTLVLRGQGQPRSISARSLWGRHPTVSQTELTRSNEPRRK